MHHYLEQLVWTHSYYLLGELHVTVQQTPQDSSSYGRMV